MREGVLRLSAVFRPRNESVLSMKFSLLVAACLLLGWLTSSALADGFVSESPVTLNATILTQGADASLTTVQSGTTITTKKIVATTFGNHEILSAMLTNNLIAAPIQGWSLVLRVDTAGNAGLFASKHGAAPVLVPAEWLSMPDFGPRVSGGITVTGKDGKAFGGLSETAFATLSVNGVPASGLATSLPENPQAKHPASSGTGKTVLTFAGGMENEAGSQIVKGTLEFSSATTAPTAGAAPLK